MKWIWAPLILMFPLTPPVFGKPAIGQKVDALNGVAVYFNGPFEHSSGRNVTPDGYNLGLKYQCVEFVKRYYFEFLKHRFPNTYGHAKDLFQKGLKDGAFNKERALIQFKNPSSLKPSVNDIIVLGPSDKNSFGHVAIISKVGDSEIEVTQQNPGPERSSREKMVLSQKDGKWRVENKRVLGWLRKK